jgi:HAD superfamily hydrolase (TIGR01490 family)
MRQYREVMAIAAVFDLDNTLVEGSSLFHFGKEMMRRRFIGPRTILRYARAEFSYVRNRAEQDGMPADVASRVLGMVEGRHQEELIGLADDFVASRLPRYYVAEVVDRLTHFVKLGIPTYIATASPQELADAIARSLGATGALGTVSETVNGVYTGRLAQPIAHGAEKAARVRAVLESSETDLENSWAFSDSVNDLPLLAMVGNPVAVHPDKALNQIALQNSWQVITPKSSNDLGSIAAIFGFHPYPMS